MKKLNTEQTFAHVPLQLVIHFKEEFLLVDFHHSAPGCRIISLCSPIFRSIWPYNHGAYGSTRYRRVKHLEHLSFHLKTNIILIIHRSCFELDANRAVELKFMILLLHSGAYNKCIRSGYHFRIVSDSFDCTTSLVIVRPHPPFEPLGLGVCCSC